MTTVSGYYQLECEIRKLKSDLKYFIGDAEMWTQEALKLTKQLDVVSEWYNSSTLPTTDEVHDILGKKK